MKSIVLPYISPREVPLSFRLGDRMIRGIPEEFRISVTETQKGSVTIRKIRGRNDNGLEITAECRTYADFSATEWLVFVTNNGSEDTEILSDLRVGGVLPFRAETLCHSNGDTRTNESYELFYAPLTEKICLSTNDGTSCNGAFPYLRLIGQDGGINAAIGWTGRWCAEIEPTADGVRLTAGQARCHTRLHPGETFRSPRLTLVAYEGDESRGRNTWRRWYMEHILLKQDGKIMRPKLCMHHFQEGGLPEFTGATEQGQLTALDTYLKQGIHPDILWMDAGWYRCDGEWKTTGNWYPDPKRFPNGLKPIGDKCRKEGIEFLLWFEPERVVEGTELAQAHPEWLLRPLEDDGSYNYTSRTLLNLGNKDCCDHMINVIDRVIKEGGVNIYRQDFNMDSYPRWVECEAADRIGAMENQHIQGYYRLWDTLLERNPGLWIDSCAGGGRRNDLETMRRSIPLHYTDVGYGDHPAKQRQHRLMFEWIPYFRAHARNWDDPVTGEYAWRKDQPVDAYAFYVAMTPALTDVLHHEADEAQFALSRKMQAIWRKAADLMLRCDYYPLTPSVRTVEDFYAMAFYDADAGDGFLNIVSNNKNTATTFTAVLDMLEPDAIYTLTEAERGEAVRRTGAELAAGFAVDLPRRSGVVYFISRQA